MAYDMQEAWLPTLAFLAAFWLASFPLPPSWLTAPSSASPPAARKPGLMPPAKCR